MEMSISLRTIAEILDKSAKPEDHIVEVNGERMGTCTRASFRIVFSWSGVEFPVDYAYELEDESVALSSRLRSQGLGKGGREQITVNGQDVEEDDVLIGMEADNLYVEFRYRDGVGEPLESVKFMAPLNKFE